MVSFRRRRLPAGRVAPSAILILVMAVLFPLLSACRDTASASPAARDAQIDLRLLTEKVTGPATIEVTVHTSGGEPVDGAEVTVRGDMNHAGMKPVIATTRGEGAGRYVTEGFEFTMAGDWIVTAEVNIPGGDRVERTVDVAGVAKR